MQLQHATLNIQGFDTLANAQSSVYRIGNLEFYISIGDFREVTDREYFAEGWSSPCGRTPRDGHLIPLNAYYPPLHFDTNEVIILPNSSGYSSVTKSVMHALTGALFKDGHILLIESPAVLDSSSGINESIATAMLKGVSAALLHKPDLAGKVVFFTDMCVAQRKTSTHLRNNTLVMAEVLNKNARIALIRACEKYFFATPVPATEETAITPNLKSIAARFNMSRLG